MQQMSYIKISALSLLLFVAFVLHGRQQSQDGVTKGKQVVKTGIDSMFREVKNKQGAEPGIQYRKGQNENNLRLLSGHTKLLEAIINKNNHFKNIMIIGAIFLLPLLLLLFGQYRVKQRSNRQLQIKQEEINEQNKILARLSEENRRLVAEIDQLLDEKEWLMKEIHHRVKNNLQIVMSLLNSQSAYLKDGAALQAIKESQHRVNAIALIHQKLYSSGDLSVIDMQSYVRDLAEYFADIPDCNRPIEFDLKIEALSLEVGQAVPLGLIINEVITNALKYAFLQGENKKIAINLHGNGGAVVLAIQDNGTGLPQNFDWSSTGALSMNLIKGLCKQLDGKMEIASNNGLRIQLCFLPLKSAFNNAYLHR